MLTTMAKRAMRATAAILLAAAAGRAITFADEAGSAHYEVSVKSAFLYHFARFVEWPENVSGPASGTPLVIGILGDDPFGVALDRAVADKSVAGRPLSVQRFHVVEDAQKCAIVYVGLRGEALTRALVELRGTPVLTVGESADFVRQGGIVAFVRADKHVSLEIDAEAAHAAGLRISSRLLSLSQMARRASLVGARR
jgi:hypothetical protein